MEKICIKRKKSKSTMNGSLTVENNIRKCISQIFDQATLFFIRQVKERELREIK